MQIMNQRNEVKLDAKRQREPMYIDHGPTNLEIAEHKTKSPKEDCEPVIAEEEGPLMIEAEQRGPLRIKAEDQA